MTMQIYIYKSSQQTGPFFTDQIRSMVESGQIDINDYAWHEGIVEWLPLHRVLDFGTTINQARQSVALSPVAPYQIPLPKPVSEFLYIPIIRLIAMSIVTIGFYVTYWMYINWRYLKNRDGLKIRPFWRAWFGIFYFNSLLKAIKNEPIPSGAVPANFSPSGLTTCYVIIAILNFASARSNNPALDLFVIILNLLTFCLLLPAQNHINAINEYRTDRPAYYDFSTGHIVCLILGILYWILILIGLLT